MATLKVDTAVRLKRTSIQGSVKKLHITDKTEISYEIEYLDEEGKPQRGVFHEDKLEVVEA
jgi:hypothetical protein